MKLPDCLKPDEDYALQDGPCSGIVLSSRVRLARNLEGFPFPERLSKEGLNRTRDKAVGGLRELPSLGVHHCGGMDSLGPVEKSMLVERHLISQEHKARGEGSAVVISSDEQISVMVNEEDHLRMQAILPGLQLHQAWKRMDVFDTCLEDRLPFAFSPSYGYLTACPTNLGTGIRASAMLHLPGLVFTDLINQTIKAAQQLGMAVRGLYGEGTEAQGDIFQVSNQMTLGETEEEIVERLHKVVEQIIEQEINSREKMVETEPKRILDRIGRAFGTLLYCHSISSSDCKNLLSMVRLGVELSLFPLDHRSRIGHLFLATEPGHLQIRSSRRRKPEERDVVRATLLRRAVAKLHKPRARDLEVRDPNVAAGS